MSMKALSKEKTINGSTRTKVKGPWRRDTVNKQIPAEIEKHLHIRYVKLHFTLEIIEDGYLPRSKASALRGGMGHVLLMANCIRDEHCDVCDFSEDCLVQRMMYPQMKIRPKFMTTKDSEGFVVECEDTGERFHAGDELKFNLLLFGRTIVYFNQYLQAFYYLGMMGIGREHVRFQISKVTNTVGDTLVEGTSVYKERYTVMNVSDYVRYRLTSSDIRKAMDADCCRLVFQSPLSLKHQGKMQEHFQIDAVIAAIERRIYILNCYEGNEEYDGKGRIPIEEYRPLILNERVWPEKVPRYSGTQKNKVTFSGIRGWCDLENIDENVLMLLAAGELLHIGKNTSFGFGKYTVVESIDK